MDKERIFISSVLILEVVKRTWQERWMIGTDGERKTFKGTHAISLIWWWCWCWWWCQSEKAIAERINYSKIMFLMKRLKSLYYESFTNLETYHICYFFILKNYRRVDGITALPLWNKAKKKLTCTRVNFFQGQLHPVQRSQFKMTCNHCWRFNFLIKFITFILEKTNALKLGNKKDV